MSGLINSAGSRSGVIGYSGDIVASGSNANGYYIKYSDGTMICRFTDGSYDITCTNQLNSTGTKYSGNKVYTYPVAFVDTAITATVSCLPQSANCVGSVEAYNSTTQINLAIWTDRSTTNAGRPSYIAIGKWK